jgi:hypothetical protein
MRLKNWLIVFFASLSILACGNKKNIPDVSNIPVSVKIERFDIAFFSTDPNHFAAGLQILVKQFPYFFTDFTTNILGVGILNDTSREAFEATRLFLTSYLPVADSLKPKFNNIGWLERELKRSFQFVKYYFPGYQLPQKVLTYIGPFDAPSVAITNNALGIGLQLYAGKNFSFYNSMQGQEMYPSFISRRFEPEYINVNCVKAIIEDLFPDKSGNRPLIEQMVEKGKSWYLTDLLLPETPDSLKTGFTQAQMEWCRTNEGLIWNYFLQGENILYTIDPDLIKNYMGESPVTQGMPDQSPGNIGQWVGWQIVKKYMQHNPAMTPAQMMNTDARKIFEETKYKPK